MFESDPHLYQNKDPEKYSLCVKYFAFLKIVQMGLFIAMIFKFFLSFIVIKSSINLKKLADFLLEVDN